MSSLHTSFLSSVLAFATWPVFATTVNVTRLPAGGVQPQAVTDAEGTVHLIYLGGEARASDIFYQRKRSHETAFPKPLRVNSQSASAVAAGTIRGAQLAIGQNGRVHVAWNGAAVHTPGKPMESAMFYTRLAEDGKSFEPQRNLMTFTTTLDGGGSVAADARGNVYVVWHGSTPENKSGEVGRNVYVARSTDGGKTFSKERPALSSSLGACACCGLRAGVDGQGSLFVLYRAAMDVMNRDITALLSVDRGESFRAVPVHKWKISKCPMSSQSFAATPAGMLAGWETDGRVYFAPLDAVKGKVGERVLVSAKGNAKHVVLAANAKGETLAAWTEGTGWQKGGAAAWQLFDRAGQPAGEAGRASDLPVWGLAAVWANADGSFSIIY
jgi:hypothetical protein